MLHVANFCKRCGCYQKASWYKGKRAPLVPLPIIDVPFKCIAMDIIGPMPHSHSGNTYILVVCDYATRYPEAMAIRSIEAERIAEELIKLFARVGIPEEILTDQRKKQDVTCAPNSNQSLPSTDRRPCGAVQSDVKEHATEVCNQRGKGLGQVASLSAVCISRSAPSLNWLLSVWAIVWMASMRTSGYSVQCVGRFPQ